MYFIASDHAGFDIKKELIDVTGDDGLHLADIGPFEMLEGDDYPLFAFELCESLLKDIQKSRGILICASGSGMVIAANKVHGIRAARCTSMEEAYLARQHNDANVLVLSKIGYESFLYAEIIKTFIETPFSFDERHVRRLAEIEDYEENEA